MRTSDATSSSSYFSSMPPKSDLYDLPPAHTSFSQPESLRERITKVAAIIIGASIIGVGVVGIKISSEGISESINAIPIILGNTVIFNGVVTIVARTVMEIAQRILKT